MIYLEDFRNIVSRLEDDDIKLNKYLDMLRNAETCIVDSVIENRYSNIISQQKDFLLECCLGSDLKNWVEWYLYERVLDPTPIDSNAWVDGVGYTISNLDSFMDFAQHGLKLPMRPREIDENEKIT